MAVPCSIPASPTMFLIYSFSLNLLKSPLELKKYLFLSMMISRKSLDLWPELKGIVSRDFEWLQMILMNRLCVPDVPLEVYSFLNSHLHTVF